MNVWDKENHRLPELIVLPTAAKALLRKNSLSREVIEFIKDCIKVLIHEYSRKITT